jgi:hypothetical protein
MEAQPMKRPLAYLTAAWSGEPDVDMELAAHYCRLAYEAGFSPICPLLYLPLFLNDSIPEEHKAGIDMRRDMLRRSHTLIVCGSAVDEDVKNDIAVAGRLGIAATTLEGVVTDGYLQDGYYDDVIGVEKFVAPIEISNQKDKSTRASASADVSFYIHRDRFKFCVNVKN